MKTFKEYLSESKKQYTFRVKVAGDFESDKESLLKELLNRYSLSAFKKTGKTPIQSLPMDFPQVKNCEVSIFEVTLDYPVTQQELLEYLATELGVGKNHMVVRRPGEPTEEYQTPAEPREGALLNDPDYKEAGNPQFEDYFGDKYNTGFVKELNDLLKLERKARGEQIPATEPAKYNVDSPAGTTSVLKQAPDPRK